MALPVCIHSDEVEMIATNSSNVKGSCKFSASQKAKHVYKEVDHVFVDCVTLLMALHSYSGNCTLKKNGKPSGVNTSVRYLTKPSRTRTPTTTSHRAGNWLAWHHIVTTCSLPLSHSQHDWRELLPSVLLLEQCGGEEGLSTVTIAHVIIS